MNKADLFYKPLLKEAWGLVKKYYWVILGIVLINIFVSMVLNFITEDPKGVPALFLLVLVLVMIAASFILKFVTMRANLWVAKKQEFKFMQIFEDISYKKVINFLNTYIIVALIIGGGIILLIVPGFIWGLKYFLAPYFSLDKGMGYKEALKASAEATKGVRLKILFFVLFLVLFILVSLIPFLLGLLITIPLYMVSMGLLYVKLSGNTENTVVVDDIVAQPLEILNEVQAQTPEPVIVSQ